MNRCNFRFWMIPALLLAFSAGCGKSRLNAVTGTITLDGQPLPDATVVFTPVAGGRPAGGRTDDKGKYSLVYSRDTTGAEAGEHIVSITTADDIEQEDGSVASVPEKVPAKYNFQTELTAIVEVGSSVHDFRLESGGDLIESENEVEFEDEKMDTGL